MCWISDKLEPLVSDGNVKVFKICGQTKDSSLYGFFRHTFKYALNKIFKTKISIDSKGLSFRYMGNEGFHSYSNDHCMWLLHRYEFIKSSKPESIDVFAKINGERIIGSYSTNGFYCFYFVSIVLVEGYIPKGSRYYINENGEIISDSIVLTNIIKKIQ